MTVCDADDLAREIEALRRLFDAAHNGRWDEVYDGVLSHDRRIRAIFERAGDRAIGPERLADVRRLLGVHRDLATHLDDSREAHRALSTKVRTGRRAHASYAAAGSVAAPGAGNPARFLTSSPHAA